MYGKCKKENSCSPILPWEEFPDVSKHAHVYTGNYWKSMLWICICIEWAKCRGKALLILYRQYLWQVLFCVMCFTCHVIPLCFRSLKSDISCPFRKKLMNMKAVQMELLDPIPTSFLNMLLNILIPILMQIINVSFVSFWSERSIYYSIIKKCRHQSRNSKEFYTSVQFIISFKAN